MITLYTIYIGTLGRRLEKYEELKEELRMMWEVKAKIIPVITGALGTMVPKLENWIQYIPGTT